MSASTPSGRLDTDRARWNERVPLHHRFPKGRPVVPPMYSSRAGKSGKPG